MADLTLGTTGLRSSYHVDANQALAGVTGARRRIATAIAIVKEVEAPRLLHASIEKGRLQLPLPETLFNVRVLGVMVPAQSAVLQSAPAQANRVAAGRNRRRRPGRRRHGGGRRRGARDKDARLQAERGLLQQERRQSRGATWSEEPANKVASLPRMSNTMSTKTQTNTTTTGGLLDRVEQPTQQGSGPRSGFRTRSRGRGRPADMDETTSPRASSPVVGGALGPSNGSAGFLERRRRPDLEANDEVKASTDVTERCAPRSKSCGLTAGLKK
jgi:hypothetical protein